MGSRSEKYPALTDVPQASVCAKDGLDDYEPSIKKLVGDWMTDLRTMREAMASVELI